MTGTPGAHASPISTNGQEVSTYSASGISETEEDAVKSLQAGYYGQQMSWAGSGEGAYRTKQVQQATHGHSSAMHALAASGAGAAAGRAAGFSKWIRSERAKGDALGFYLSLVFHGVTLSKWRTLPPTHLLYFVVYTLATLGALAWQRSGRASYAAWRDWVQAAIRLDVFLTTYRTTIWLQSARNLPPALPGHPVLSWAATLPVVAANTMAVHLLMLPLAHPLSLWPHLAVQLACVVRVVRGAATFSACATPFFRHPTARCILAQMHELLGLLRLAAVSPLGTRGAAQRGACSACSRHCQVAMAWLQVMCGVVISVGLRAVLDLKAYRSWQQQQQQKEVEQQQRRQQKEVEQPRRQAGAVGQQAESGQEVVACGWYDAVCDSLTARLLVPLAGTARSPIFWVLMSGAVMDAVVLLTS